MPDHADTQTAAPQAGLDIPRYAELPRIPEVGGRHAWSLFGEHDDVGRINLLTPDVVAAAVTEARTGEVFGLTLPLDLPEPAWSASRAPLQHHIFSINRNAQDDYVDSLYLQRSTQWDGLRHVAAREFGFYGGVRPEDAGQHGSRLGIEHWARRGIVGRGVMVDVARYVEIDGRPLDPRVATPLDVDALRETLHAQGVALRRGDIMLLHTGYLDAYLAADQAERVDFSVNRQNCGLSGSEAMAEFLWDSGVVAVVSDNPAVEVVPGDPAIGSLHRRLIPLLGFALGELFDLSGLSAHCAADGRYTCLFVGIPLHLPGGVGSPGNAIAIK